MVARPPCKGCEDRSMSCHSTCEKYLDFKKLNDEIRKNERILKKKNNPYYYC